MFVEEPVRMKVKIKENARKTFYWYANHVGEVFEVKGMLKGNEYLLTNGRGVFTLYCTVVSHTEPVKSRRVRCL